MSGADKKRWERYIFAWTFLTIPGVCDDEQLLVGADMARFHSKLVERATFIGEMLVDNYYEAFNLVDYSELVETDDPAQRALIDSVADSEETPSATEVWRVLKCRMQTQGQLISQGVGTVEGLEEWVSEFNGFIESGIMLAWEDAWGSIDIYRPQEFAPHFLEQLLREIYEDQVDSGLRCLKPFQQRLEYLDFRVRQDDWPIDDCEFGRFLEWVLLYQLVTSEEE